MKVWVTGAAGMLGREVVDALRVWRLPHVATGHELDIAEPDAVGELWGRERPTLVVNCAAFTKVDEAESASALALRTNALGPEVLGQAAATAGASVLHFSTDYVFAGAPARAYSEQDPAEPLNAYGRSKREGERRLLAACPDSWVVRTSWLFGVHGRCFAGRVLERMLAHAPLEVVDDQHGRPTYARDLARASLALAGLGPRAALDVPPGIHHFANAGVTTWYGLACGVHEVARRRGLAVGERDIRPVTSDTQARAATRPAHAVLDTTRTDALLGGQARTWQAALEDWLEARLEARDG